MAVRLDPAVPAPARGKKGKDGKGHLWPGAIRDG
jgi:hypothetical protein